MSRARADIMPVFVKAETAAALCEIGIEKWQDLVKRGIVPGPAVRDAQTIRWHWPSVENALARQASLDEMDPSVLGAMNAKGKPR